MDCYLRKAEWEDVALLFSWANDPAVRENSFHSDPIDFETHERWYRSLLNDPDRKQYIFCADGIDAGQLRLALTGDTVEISYSVSREHRGKGYGKRLLQLASDEAKRVFPSAKAIVGKVKPENDASKASFLSAGYQARYVEYLREI